MGNAEEHPDESGGSALGSSRVVLSNLLHAGNIDRLVEEALRFLERDPEDLDAHYFRCLGLIRLDCLPDAKHHVDSLLEMAPDSTEALHAAIQWNLCRRRYGAARKYLAEALRLAPDSSLFHHLSAIEAGSSGRIKQACRHVVRARELDPDNPEIIDFHIRLHGVDELSVTEAYRDLRQYEEGLRLDPENARLHAGIGDLCLGRIDDPARAEYHFRQALRSNPADRDYQRALFEAVAKRSLIYRLFSHPARVWRWVGDVIRGLAEYPFRILLILFAFKFVCAFFAWLIVSTVLFYPGGKLYEWLLVSEIRAGARTPDGSLRVWTAVQSWPIWSRFLLFLILLSGLWLGLFGLLRIPVAEGGLVVLVLGGIHFFFVFLFWLIRKGLSWSARRALEREARRAAKREKGITSV